ncbi:hypothetical protein LCGC14_2451330 [marine sediment metagenome]|uniref:Ribbon-helix-helix protein CopG domain-containing protein n=1 Tax=marine sediment metagenome TaxID=412755 RepID=A0A0F9E9Y2_9ZZZZ
MTDDNLILEDKTHYTPKDRIGKQINIWIPKELMARLNKLGEIKGYNKSELVRFALDKVLEANGF